MLSDLDIGWFLGAHPRFRPNKNADSAEDEFERLAVSKMWKIGGKRYTNAKEAFEARHSQHARPAELTDELADKLEELDFDDVESIATSSACSSDAGVCVVKSPPNRQASRFPALHSSPSAAYIQDCPGASSGGLFLTYNRSANSYFKKFTDFKLDHSKTLATEFNRLALQQKWDKKSREYFVERTECYMMQFQLYFGIARNNLQAWQQLCRDLKIKEIPVSVKQCKKSVGGIYVNIYDFIQCKADGRPITPVFKTYEDFKGYTNNMNGKFPRVIAKQNPFLQVLLKACK